MLYYIAGSAALLYLIFFAYPWVNALCNHQESGTSYLIGFLFAALYYLSIPLLWWLYGWEFMLKVILGCTIVTAVTVNLINLFYSFDSLLLAGMFFQIPVRVAVGGWLAKNHLLMRDNRSKA